MAVVRPGCKRPHYGRNNGCGYVQDDWHGPSLRAPKVEDTRVHGSNYSIHIGREKCNSAAVMKDTEDIKTNSSGVNFQNKIDSH